LKLGIVSDENSQKVLGPLERQRVQSKPSVVGLADPSVLVLGTVVDQESIRAVGRLSTRLSRSA
jgi:hypothetical protein